MTSTPTAPAPVPTLLSGPLRALTVGSVALVSLGAFEAIAVATAMPTVAAALDGVAAYALAFGLPLATSVIGMVLAGVWSDARGPAASMRVGVAAFVLGLLVAGLAPSMPVLAVGRAVQGLGSGLFSVALYVVVGRVVPPALRPRIFAAFAAAWLLPAVAGPPLAGLLVEHAGWRWVFLLAAVLAVPAALLVEPGLGRCRGCADRIDGGRPAVPGGGCCGRSGPRSGRPGCTRPGSCPDRSPRCLGAAALAAVAAVRAAAAAGRGAARPPGAAQRDPGPRADLGARSSAPRRSCRCCCPGSAGCPRPRPGWCSPWPR